MTLLCIACSKDETNISKPETPEEEPLELAAEIISLNYLQTLSLQEMGPSGSVWSIAQGEDSVVSLFNDTLVARGKGKARVTARLGNRSAEMKVTVTHDEFIPVKELELEINGIKRITISNDSLAKMAFTHNNISLMECFHDEAVKEIRIIGYKPENATMPVVERVTYVPLIWNNTLSDGWRLQQRNNNEGGEMLEHIHCFNGSLNNLQGEIGKNGKTEVEPLRFANYASDIEGDSDPRLWEQSRGTPMEYRAQMLVFEMKVLPDILQIGNRKNAKETTLEYNLLYSTTKNNLYTPSNSGGKGWQILQGRLKWLFFEMPNSIGLPETIPICPGDTIGLHFVAKAPEEFAATAEWAIGYGKSYRSTSWNSLCGMNAEQSTELYKKLVAENPSSGNAGAKYAFPYIKVTPNGTLTCSSELDPDYQLESGWKIKDVEQLIPLTVFMMGKGCSTTLPYLRTFSFQNGDAIVSATQPHMLCATTYIRIVPPQK